MREILYGMSRYLQHLIMKIGLTDLLSHLQITACSLSQVVSRPKSQEWNYKVNDDEYVHIL